jgi:nicotinate-nucleotide adenylyltransferase
MVRLAIAGNPRFTVSDIEVKRGGKSYTVETVAALHTMHPVTEFYFITGLDSFLEIQTWNQWERLLPLCSFVVLSRPGYRFADLVKIDFMKGATRELAGLDSGELVHAVFQPDGFKICLEMIPLYDISSTDIRNRIHESRTVKYHLPEAVETYIIKNKLYA